MFFSSILFWEFFRFLFEMNNVVLIIDIEWIWVVFFLFFCCIYFLLYDGIVFWEVLGVF